MQHTPTQNVGEHPLPPPTPTPPQIVQLNASGCAVNLMANMDKTLAEGNLHCRERQDVYQVQRENKRKLGTNKELGDCFQEDCLVIKRGLEITEE